MVWLVDADELFQLADPRYAVMVVKHKYVPQSATKWITRYNFLTLERTGVV